ncbi:MAG: hypothetical protein CMF60_02220 [Magnetococcales bacterium]|nr:hypothetical protein [Magnetococcales bacterium]|tara:strand:+ start:50745 stop:51989 length:1245 start_codon:yes stop_codon:yes gene_type:complete
MGLSKKLMTISTLHRTFNLQKLARKCQFLVLSAMLLCTAMHAFAQDGITPYEQTFVVKNYEVKEYNGPIFNMRERALTKVKKEALGRLLKQITPRKTWGVHSQIIAQANIDNLFYKAVIDQEEITNHYQASVHVFYRQSAVRDLLARYGVPYSKSTGGRVMLLPLYEYASNLVMWESQNPVKEALQKAIKSSAFFEYVFPKGTVAERNKLSAKLAMYGAGDVITDVAKAYDAEAAVVVYVKISERYDGFYLDVTATWFEEDTLVEPVIYSLPLNGLVLFDGYPDEDKLATYLDTAFADVLSRLGEHKRHENLIEVDKPGRIFLRFKPQDPTDLEKIQTRVSALSSVKNFKLRVLNIKDSVFQVDYYGERLGFKNALIEAGMTVEETTMPMVWKVAFQNDPFLGPVDYSIETTDQ